MKKMMVKKLMNRSSSLMRKTKKKMRELKRALRKYQTMKKR
jgi:hypothetical protein